MSTQVLDDERTTARKVSFSKSATIVDVETKLEKAFLTSNSFSESIESLELDFSSSEYIEVVSLVFIIALVANRAKRGLHTKIRLPLRKKTRDFLRVWQFPDAIRRATRIPFAELVCKEDLRYFGENLSEDQTEYLPTTFDRAIGRLLSDRFFAIQTLALDPSFSGLQLVLAESNRWENRLVKSVLSKHLSGPEGYLASRIVFESMTNAIRHSAARIIQTASRFAASGEDQGGSVGQFTVIYWDDGQSMIETLKSAIRGGKTIRSEAVPPAVFSYRVIEELSDQKRTEKLFHSTFTPDSSAEDHLLLFATILPGITRDVEGKNLLVHRRLKDDMPSYTGPGMGLYVLVNTVVDVFGGSLSFRTGEYFMNIKKAFARDREAKYRVKIKSYDKIVPSFLGNMLTIRLPISQEQEQ